jgi:hypothetical protein
MLCSPACRSAICEEAEDKERSESNFHWRVKTYPFNKFLLAD